MPLADVADNVARFFEMMGDGRDFGRQPDSVAPNSVFGRIHARPETSTGWSAKWLICDGDLEKSPFASQSVKVGRQVHWAAVDANGVPSLLVGEENQNAWRTISAACPLPFAHPGAQSTHRHHP